MYALAKRLFPIGRSITGSGVRETLTILQKHIPLKIYEVPTGTKVFDWTVPKEWNVKGAYIVTPDGRRIAEYRINNLHLAGYSIPIDKELPLAELQKHLHSIEDQPDAIPYVTSYYAEHWGFCLSHNDRKSLKEGTYRVHIDTTLKKGSLTYGELVIPGSSKKEIFLSTYICHPSIANDGLSGPVLAVGLASWLMSAPRTYTYRIIFIPEIIGSLAYLSKHLQHLKKYIIAGFILTCVGDEREYSFMPSRTGNTLADRVARRVLRMKHSGFKQWSYLDRGSDERNYCSPGADLPLVSMMRSRYGTFPEYHTSLDNLSFITPAGLKGSFALHSAAIKMIEREPLYKATFIGEPQLGKRGLYPTLSKKGSVEHSVQRLLDILTYADGTHSATDIAEILNEKPKTVESAIKLLLKSRLLIKV